jgi:hypothetical protein
VGDVLIAVVLGGLAFWGFNWFRTRSADEALDARFQTAYREAQKKLPPEDFERLTEHLVELRGAVIEAARLEGWNGKRATREGKTAAIQAINGFIAIDGMFTPTSRAA